MKKIYAGVLLSLAALAGGARAQSLVYVSNAESGTITGYQLDKTKKMLVPIGSFPAGAKAMSSVVSPDKKMLYVSVRSKPYSVAAYRIQPDGQLVKAGQSPLPESMAYLSLDKQGHYLLSASYGGDLFSINRIDSQGLVQAQPVQVVRTGKRPHAIQVDPDNHFLFVTLLGTDQLLQYRFDAASGKVTPNDPPFVNIQSEAAAGPRHFAIAPASDAQGKRSLYVLTEMAGNISQLTLNADGTTTPVATIDSVSPKEDMQRGEARPLTEGRNLPATPKPRIWQADIHITPNGRFLYATERTSSTLSSFSIDPRDGHLTYLTSIKTEQQPRGFAIDNSGRFLIESGEKSPWLSLYSVDPTSGTLTLNGRYATGKGANWVSLAEE